LSMRAVAAGLALFALAVATGVAAAAVVGPTPVKTGTTASEQNPAASTDWFAWTQSPTAHPNRTNVWAEPTPVDGADQFKVNPDGTHAWTGGILGDLLVYQEIDEGDSDIRLYDLAAKAHLPDPPINSTRWEWHPTMSMDTQGDTWILFARQNISTGTQRVLAYNVDTADTRVLAETSRRSYALIPGQVNGDWAAWATCMPSCQARFVNLVDGTPRQKVPRPTTVRHQYAPSITADGTVYFAASKRGCGASVKIGRYRSGAREILVSLPDRRDIFFTYTSEEVDGPHVFFDRVNCGTGAWNIYKIVDQP
jgi:hypothetical protein